MHDHRLGIVPFHKIPRTKSTYMNSLKLASFLAIEDEHSFFSYPEMFFKDMNVMIVA